MMRRTESENRTLRTNEREKSILRRTACVWTVR